MDAAVVMFNKSLARITATPTRVGGKSHGSLNGGVRRTIVCLVSGTVAQRAGLSATVGTSCTSFVSADMMDWDEAGANRPGAIHPVSCGNRTFFNCILIAFCKLRLDVWKDSRGRDLVETTFRRPVCLGSHGVSDSI